MVARNKAHRSGALRHYFALLASLLSLLGAATAFAKDASDPGVAEPAVEEPKPKSPRSALQKYLELARAGRYDEAGQLLDVSKPHAAERAVLARHLKAVLDRHLWFDLEKISDADGGVLDDGLPANLEQLGAIPGRLGNLEPVRLRRRADQSGWLFSPATVGRIDDWYQALEGRWLLEHLPAVLLRPGPRDVLWWQWIGLLLLGVGAAGLGALSSSIVRRLLAKAAKRTATTLDDKLLARSAGPLTLAFGLGLARSLLPLLSLYLPAERFIHGGLRGLFLADLLWMFWRLLDVAGELAWASQWSRERPGSRALIPLARRAGKAVVGVAAAILLLSALGYPVTSLIAGLGIGGLALALASQKTVENLFGAFSLGIDQPFREGDFVRIEDLVGTVESLGLRSTRIRTLDRTLVSIPNGKLAEMRLETFAARDRLRLACTVGLVYQTSEAQMRAVLAGLESVLRAQPKIWPEVVMVRFKELAASSLDIDVMAWFATSDWNEFLVIRQDVLLAFMRVVEEAGTSFAFPTQTVQLVKP